MKLHKVIHKEQKATAKFPSRYVSEHLRHTWENPLTTATILGYLQVTHVKATISKQKGWDFTNN